MSFRLCIHAGADWAAWLLPGGPAGPTARWDATSNVEIGQLAYAYTPLAEERYTCGRGETGVKDSHKEEKRKGEWNRGGSQGPLARGRDRY